MLWANVRISVVCLFVGALTAGCDFFSTTNTCTDDIRLNVCVTRPDGGPESFILREIRGGASDTVAGAPSVCFPETSQEQRILVVADGVPVDSSAWFTQASRSCGREPATVSFD